MTILWTIQHADAFHRMQNEGILIADEQYLFCGEELRFAYDWMARQMKEKLCPPPAGVSYPVWAWFQYLGVKKRCDLRKTCHGPTGTPLVQIEFEAKEDTFLLSDFDDWNCVLNNCFLSDSEEQADAFYRQNHADRQAEIELSWNKVFDINSHFPDWRTPLNQKTIQATLWCIKANQIRKVTHFTAR